MTKRKLLYWLPACACAALIFLLSHQSNLLGWRRLPDVVLHFFEYALFGLTLAWGVTLGFRRLFKPSGFLITFCIATLYALSDEYHQTFVPNRVASFGDVAADVAGAVVCLGVVYAVIGEKSR